MTGLVYKLLYSLILLYLTQAVPIWQYINKRELLMVDPNLYSNYHYAKLDFTVHKRDNADYKLGSLTNYKNLYYLVDLEIGDYKNLQNHKNMNLQSNSTINFNGGQKMQAMLDTGSSDIVLQGSANSYCSATDESKEVANLQDSINKRSLLQKRKNVYSSDTSKSSTSITGVQNKAASKVNCFENGFYTPSFSSTYKANSSTDFSLSYGDGTFLKGQFVQDNAIVGDSIHINDMNFGVVNEGDSTISVFGIGSKNLELRYVNSKGSDPTYENFAYQVAQQQGLKKVAYSICLDPNNDQTKLTNGTILFGAVDNSKVSGDFASMRFSDHNGSPGFYIQLDSVEVIYNGKSTSDLQNTTSKVSDKASTSLLDAGSSLSFFPSNVFSNVENAIPHDSVTSNGLIVDCDILQNANNYFRYNFVSDSNKEKVSIDVPFYQYKITASVGDGKCLLGVASEDSDYVTLGDAFFRSSYLVFNLEDEYISLAKVNTDTSTNSKENIKLIG